MTEDTGEEIIDFLGGGKMGKVLAVIDVLLFSEGSDKPVAHASLTYSIPPRPAG